MDLQTVVTSVLTSVFASGAIAAGITGYVSRRGSERAIQVENITKERKNWRDKVREQALEVHRAAAEKNYTRLAELRLTLCLNLNPLDKEDRAIIAIIGNLSEPKQTGENMLLVEFSDRVALLLKHDWERAKREAKGFQFPFFRSNAPVRARYEEWIKENAPEHQLRNAP